MTLKDEVQKISEKVYAGEFSTKSATEAIMEKVRERVKKLERHTPFPNDTIVLSYNRALDDLLTELGG